MVIVWVVSIIATVVIAEHKKLNVGAYFILSILLGPLAVIIAAVVTPPSMQGIDNLQDARRQLRDLKDSVCALQEKINHVEISINELGGQQAVSEVERMVPRSDTTEVSIRKEPMPEEQEGTSTGGTVDMELDFGRNWLNKIGIAVFTLGVGFLISYTFKYFGPFLKIMFGYLISLVLFFLGFKLEAKEKFVNFGRVLLGGGWALVYFTTYAMHHFEASRLIENQITDLVLLAGVVVGMMAHVLRYKSEGMMSIALFVAYITATLGQITSFTIISCLLLALVILFLVYNFQWVKTFILGVVLTYGIHYVWVMPNIVASTQKPSLLGIATSDYHMLMNFIFLTSYWLVFFAGGHMAKTVKDSRLVRMLAATNFGNIALYSVLAYPIVLKLFYSQRFSIVFGAGILYLIFALVMKRAGREKLYISDIVAAVFLITFSMPLKFLPVSTLLIWLVEVPFLLFVGFHFREKIFCQLSYVLSVWVALRLIFLCFFREMPDVSFLGFTWTWQEFMWFWASISMAVCFYLSHQARREGEFDSTDAMANQFFSAASCGYLTLFIFSLVHQPWLTLALSLEGLALLAVGIMLSLMRFRIYAYLVLGSMAGIFVTEIIRPSSHLLKWLILGADVLTPFAAYGAVKYFKQIKRMDSIFEEEETLVFWAGVILLTLATFQYVRSSWISLSLGIMGVLFVLTGIWDACKTERWGGLVLFALTLGRVFLVDLAELDTIFKIITFIVLGVLFLGISFVYNRFNIGQANSATASQLQQKK